MLRDAPVSQWKPRKGKDVEGVRVDFRSWMRKPALTRSWICSMHMVNDDPMMRMSSR
jgi:hypothetical protein